MAAYTRPPGGGEGCGFNPCDRRKLGAKTSLVLDGKGVITGVATTGANRPDAEILVATLHRQLPYRVAKAPAGSVSG